MATVMRGVHPVREVYRGRPDRSWRVCHGEALTDADVSGWILWAWMCTPTGLLSDEITCEVVKVNSDRAFTVAFCAAEHHGATSRQRKRTLGGHESLTMG